MDKMNPVVHFEMPAEDRKRMADFYTRAFGWKAQFLGEDMGNYVTVATVETDENRMPKHVGAINGGFYQRNDQMPSNCPSLVIAVDDVKEHIRIISEAGGTVLGEPVNIPGIGQYVSFRDTEGNVCSILQPVMPQREKQEVQEFGLTGEI
jgi:predicted enzyme related to lactoylglutathione lyase